MYLVVAAIIPIIALGFFIYSKDKNKEPKGLLAKIFFLGVLTILPVLVCELFFESVFPMDQAAGFIPIFINVFFGVALFEEFFKWLVVKFFGYNSREFDEIFDVIVYSVFASLGFACLENILYVLQQGFANAILRALLAIPGHTCFAISMGYFLSKAKVAEINGDHNLYKKNIFLSLLIPMILHTFYDALLFVVTSSVVELIPFLIFYLAMVITCFLTVDKIAKIQQNITSNLDSGVIVRNDDGHLQYHVPTNLTPPLSQSGDSFSNGVFPDKPVSIPSVQPANDTPTPTMETRPLNYCPVCGKPIKGENFCGKCGFKLK